jgi:hypothetical protein
MKKRTLGLLIALNISWNPLFANWDNQYLDKLLDDPKGTLEIQTASAKNYTEDMGFNFNPDHLNLTGALAKRQYEREIAEHPPIAPVFESHDSVGGHVELRNFMMSHRFEGIAKNVHQKLREIYGNKILSKPVRVINNVGGIRAVMEIYNCSLNEYLALFGTILPQNGYSGSYGHMEVYDIMVDGQMISHGIEKETTLPYTYGPGEISLLEKNDRRLYGMSEGSWMIDYGRGFIPPALWEGVLLPYMSNNDSASMKDQLGQCAKSFFKVKR